MHSSTLSLAAFFVNAVFSVTQVVSEGPVAPEDTNFADTFEDVWDGKRVLSPKKKSYKAAKVAKKKAKKGHDDSSVSDDIEADTDSQSSDEELSSDEENVCEEIVKPTVAVVTHATSEDDIFWSTWKEGAENALNDTAYLEWNAVGYDAAAATEALKKACSSSDAVIVTVPYASNTEEYDKMDDAINSCIFDHAKPVFTANTDTYHNDDVMAYFGSSNYDMGVKCALAILFPDENDIISGRESLPEASSHSMDIRIYWDALSKKDEGLHQRFLGLKNTFQSFGREVVKYLPTGRPSCPCVSQYPEGVDEDNNGLKVTIDGEVYEYPAMYGLETCSRHDKNMIPSCHGSNPPAFCDKTWCYVDPDNCDSVEPSTEGEYIWTDYPGQEWPYSYETCGSKNLYLDFIGVEDSSADDGDDGTGLTGENIQTIVLSSNWAPDFEAGDRPESVFICGDETYSMPHIPQLGQSPFLQGLSAAATAAASARGVGKGRQWKAFRGNSAASSSSSSYHGPKSHGSFAVCLNDISNNNPVSGARVQCWDNDNNALGQEIGAPNLTDDNGCCTIYYDSSKSWDWAFGNAKRPDIYCQVNYNGAEWRTREYTNHDGSFFVESLRETIPPPHEAKVCVVSTSFNNEPVSGAHVQCFDNDNNGFGTPVGDKGMTGEDGCYTAKYDPSSVGDPYQLWGQEPDLYCEVSYLGEEKWKTNQNEGVNNKEPYLEFSTLRVPTIFRSKIKESLSRYGKSIVEMFERYNVKVGPTWDVFADAEFEEDWIIQHPPREYVGKSSLDLPVAKTCKEGEDNCNAEFGLKTCQTDDDCERVKVCPGPGEKLYNCTDKEKTTPFASGMCREVDATRQSENSPAQKLCVGHSDFLYDRMFNHIIQAEDFVDVTSLDSPNIVGHPTGDTTRQFGAMFRNAMRYLDSQGKNIIIKFLFASYPFKAESDESPKKILEDFLRGTSLSTRITIYVGTYRTGADSFNHGKTITVDGKKVLTGGSNYYPSHYLDFEPTHDVNIMVSNGPAMGAHSYAAKLWEPMCKWTFGGTGLSHVEAATWKDGKVDYVTGNTITTGSWVCMPAYPPTRNRYEKTENGAMVIQAARLDKLASDEGGNAIEDGQKTSDLAMLAMMEAAQISIKFSQQDILPLILQGNAAFASAALQGKAGFDCGSRGCSGMNRKIFDDTWRKMGGIAKAISRGVPVYMMVSAPCAFAAEDPNDQTGSTYVCPTNGTTGEGFDYWSMVLETNGGKWPAPRQMDMMYNHITANESPLGAGSNRRRLIYGYGWILEEIADWLFAYYAINIQHRPKRTDGSYKNTTEVVDHICEFVNIAHVRLTADEATYMRGANIAGGQIGNHAKLLMVDDALFYVGSDNAYAAGLQEFGLIVDDVARSKEFNEKYWTPLWTQAKAGLVSGDPNNCKWKSHFDSKEWDLNGSTS